MSHSKFKKIYICKIYFNNIKKNMVLVLNWGLIKEQQNENSGQRWASMEERVSWGRQLNNEEKNNFFKKGTEFLK